MKTLQRTAVPVRWIVRVIFFIGLIGCIIPFLDILTYYEQLEFPNTLTQGLYVDDKYIYCGSQVYERIQVYDKHGNFVRGFSTDVGKGSGFHFTFHVTNNELSIYVYGAFLKSERLDRKIVYSLDGSLLHATDVPSVEYAGYNVVNEARDSHGNNYIFKGFLFPRVIKDSGQNRSVVIGTPFYFWPFQAPFPAFAFFFIPLLYFAGFKRMFRSRHQTLNVKI